MSEQIAAYQEEKERFAVTDEASAEWCLEKIEENAKGRGTHRRAVRADDRTL